MPIAIDLFCGVGGLTHGLQRAGIDVAAGIDVDESCRFAYEVNNNSRFLNMDIRNVTFNTINQYFEGADNKVLVGCAPCQPFSTYSNSVSMDRKLDKWYLLDEFARLISEIMPDYVSMENVPNLMRQEVFMNFVNELETLGYSVVYSLLYCPDYGIPQSRTRLVLIATLHGEIHMPIRTHVPENYVTVRDSIGYLPPIKSGGVHPNDIIHQSSRLSEINMRRIRQSKPGGSWKDWDKNLVAECHQKDSGRTYSSVYGRMEWDKVSPTITTQFNGFGNGRFGHPEQDRALSIREGAILQSFPIDYIFHEEGIEFNKGNITRHIGNAVPVRLGEVVGMQIMNHIQQRQGNNE